ncbi:Spherulation-specific family 4-domain-containing protein [Mycena vulgaris]|nr:Spherulation-specific family 4-domain-containing protein [Mycena vulgaris]
MLPYGALILLIQLLVAPCIHALGVLIPLYVYPGTNCAAWTPVSNAISAHPSTQFYIIINPNSGPGSPDSLYQGCVAALPSSANQITLGYIDVKAGNVAADITTYAGWDSAARPTGIFFDGVSASANGVSTAQDYASQAKAQGFTFIALDPGQTTDASYFGIADLVNTYEDSYSSFSAASLSGTFSKQSVILVNAPATGSYSAVISQLESLGVAAVYITNVPVSSQDIPVQFSEFVSEVAGSSTSSGSTSSGSTSSGSTSSGSTSSGSTSSGSTSSSGTDLSSSDSTSSGSTNSNSSGNTPSDPSNPNSSAASSGGTSAKTGGSTVGTKSPSSTSAGSASQSALVKGNIATSTGQSASSAASSAATPGATNQPTSASAFASHNGPPIAAIVGGILGALVIILIALVIFLCIRRRRRPAVSLEAVAAPFTTSEAYARSASLNPAPVLSAPSSSSWTEDVKVPVPSTSATMSGVYSTTPASSPSTRDSLPSTARARLSASPTYGTEWSGGSSTGPPPAYYSN